MGQSRGRSLKSVRKTSVRCGKLNPGPSTAQNSESSPPAASSSNWSKRVCSRMGGVNMKAEGVDPKWHSTLSGTRTRILTPTATVSCDDVNKVGQVGRNLHLATVEQDGFRDVPSGPLGHRQTYDMAQYLGRCDSSTCCNLPRRVFPSRDKCTTWMLSAVWRGVYAKPIGGCSCSGIETANFLIMESIMPF